MSKRIKGITIELDGDAKGLDKALSDVNKQSNRLTKELKDVERLLKFNPGNAELVAQKQKLLAEQVENTREKLKRLKDAQADVDRQFAEGKINQAQYDAFQREIIETESKLKHFEGQLASAQSKLKAFGDSAIDAGKKMKDVGKSMTSAGKDLTMKVTTPIMGAAAAAVLVGTNFEQSMSNVAAISGATGKDFQLLEAKAREMGATTNKSASEAADAMSYMALAGWDTQQMIGGIEPILKLSSAGNIDLARTSDLVTDSMAAMQLQVSDLPGFLDMVAKASQKSNTDIDKLMEAFLVAGGTMASFNVPLEESTAVLGILANRGFKGAEAGTALNAIFTNLTSGLGNSGKAMRELGISAFDADGNFKGLEAVLMEVKDKTANMTDEQKAHYISMIAGKEHLKSFNAILAGLGDEYGELKGEVSNAEGALQKMYEVMTDNLKGRWDEFRSAIEEAGIAIFKNLQPALESLLGFLQMLADWFNNLSPAMQNTIMVIAGIAAAIGPTLVVLGLLVSSIGSILTVVGTVAGAIATFTAGAAAATPAVSALAGVFTFLTGPIGIAIAAIAAIGIALVAAYAKFEWFRDLVGVVWDAIKNVIKSALDGLVSFVNEIATQITTYWNENGQLIKDATTNVWNAISGVIKTVLPAIQAIFNVVMTAIKVIVQSVWDNIKGVIKGALDVVMGLVKTFAGLFTGNWQAMWDGIKQLFSGAIELLWNAVQLMLWGRLLKGIAVFAGSFRGAITTMWGAIKEVFTASINGIRSFFTAGFNAMKSVGNTTMSSLKSIITTVWNSIKSVFTSVVNTIKNTVSSGFSNVVSAIRTQMSSAVSTVRTKLTEMVTAVTGRVKDFLSAGKDLIRGLIQGIKDMTAQAVGAITGVVDSVVEKAKSLLRIASPSKLFEQFGIWTGEGLAIGISSTQAANEKAITGVAKVISAAAKENAAEVTKIADKAEKDRTAIQQEYAKKRAELSKKSASDSQAALKTHKNKKGQIVKTGESKVLKIRQDASAKLARLNEEEQKKLAKINDKAWNDMQKEEAKVNKERLEAIKLYVKDKQSAEELSLYAESEIWRKSLAVFKEGTKERVEVQTAYKKATDAINKEVESINKDYLSKVESLNKEFLDGEKKLNDEYQKTLDDRVRSLYTFAGIFDEIAQKEVSGAGLLQNLKDQVSAFEDWQKNITALAAKGIDGGLLAELREMGPKAGAEIAALNTLTDEQLQQYVALWQEKNKLAREQAASELTELKKNTEKQVNELRIKTAEQLRIYQNEWRSSMVATKGTVKNEMSEMPNIGSFAVSGLISGMLSKKGELQNAAQSLADIVTSTFQSALDIHSPSRVFRDFGININEGLIDGIRKSYAKVQQTMATVYGSMAQMNGISEVFSGQQGGNVSTSTQHIENHYHMSYHSPKPLDPYESARLTKNSMKELGMQL